MAANRQQGGYLGAFLLGFTALPAGLVAWTSEHPVIGVLLTLAGVALLSQSLAGFCRIRSWEHGKEG